jgi:hypothetical protein
MVFAMSLELLDVNPVTGVHLFKQGKHHVKRSSNHPHNHKYTFPDCLIKDYKGKLSGKKLLAHACSCKKCEWIKTGKPSPEQMHSEYLVGNWCKEA